MSFVFEIQSIQLFAPDIKEEYCLTIIINNTIPFKSNFFCFSKKSNTHQLNQKFDINIEIKTLKVQIYPNVPNPRNPLFKGENEHFTDTDSLISKHTCSLFNNNNEKSGEFSYTISPKITNNGKAITDKNTKQMTSPGVSSIDDFDANLKKIQKEIDTTEKTQKKKREKSSLLDLASGANAENFTLFVHNMNYLQSLLNVVMEIVLWKNFWKTICILSIISLMILYNQFFMLILVPFALILFHLCNREVLIDEYSHKKVHSDRVANMKLIIWTIELTNETFDKYETMLQILQTNNLSIVQDFYFEILKLIGWNILLYFSNILSLVNYNLIIVIAIWGQALYLYPPFRAFVLFLVSFAQKNIKVKRNDTMNLCVGISIHYLLLLVPFLSLIIKVKNAAKEKQIEYAISSNKNSAAKKRNSSILQEALISLIDRNDNSTMMITGQNMLSSYNDPQSNSNQIENFTSQVLKYEIYENERWWIGVSWSKKMLLDEIPLWCEVSKPTIFCDKNMIFLNDNEKWTSEWKIESNEKSDGSGWEYGKSFDNDSKFGQKSTSKYVRRRKWVRYAQKVQE